MLLKYELLSFALATSVLPATRDLASIELLIDTYKVVVGVYEDETVELGYSFYVIKGAEDFKRLPPNEPLEEYPNVTALWCDNLAQAVDYQTKWGDLRYVP